MASHHGVLGVMHVMIYFSCHHHCGFCLHIHAKVYILHLVPVLFSIVIPTPFNILMKSFHTCKTIARCNIQTKSGMKQGVVEAKTGDGGAIVTFLTLPYIFYILELCMPLH